jgi:hypothetical protein
MIPVTHREAEITAAVVKIALNLSPDPDTIKGLRITESEVIVITPTSLHSIGKPYFRQLVKQVKQVKQEKQAARSLVGAHQQA